MPYDGIGVVAMLRLASADDNRYLMKIHYVWTVKIVTVVTSFRVLTHLPRCEKLIGLSGVSKSLITFREQYSQCEERLHSPLDFKFSRYNLMNCIRLTILIWLNNNKSHFDINVE